MEPPLADGSGSRPTAGELVIKLAAVMPWQEAAAWDGVAWITWVRDRLTEAVEEHQQQRTDR